MANEKQSSLYALDALNFCNAGIQTGLGPFLAIYYTSVRHWNPGQIGILIACQSLVGILIQSWVGHFVDQTHSKRILTAAAAVTVSAGAVGIGIFAGFPEQIAVQLLIGMAVTVIPAATGAFALGLVKKEELTKRVARNESFTHSGNLLFAIAAGILGTFLALQEIFYAAAVFAFGMAIAVMFIQDSQISYEAARGGKEGGENEGKGEKQEANQPKGIRELFQDKRILLFTAAIVLFNVSNAATLPLVGEILSKNKGGNSAWQVAAAIVVAEAVMIAVAAYSGKIADQWGRKPLFLIAFIALAIRAGLSTVSYNPYYLISLQAFDGVAAAIYGVLLTLVTADLARGTGRFNFLQGAVQSAMGLGGFLSNIAFGWIAHGFGFNVSFWGLALVALGGGALYQFQMPETKPDQSQGEEKQAAEAA